MTFQNHNRVYDLVVFGASGYTGTRVAEYISTSFPTNLKWAIAGRSPAKLANLATRLKELSPDRPQPVIETADANTVDLDALAKKTFVLIATVGPFLTHGEPAFRACAENGTHYFDTTGEVPFTARMIHKYEDVAKASGALLFPQCGIESAPPDLITWMVAKVLRTELQARTGAVTTAMTIKGKPSGGTLHTIFTALETLSLSELRAVKAPYVLSPVPKANAKRGPTPFFYTLLGSFTMRTLGRLATSLTGTTDAAIVERTWGLLSSTPSRQAEFYGPNFSFAEYVRVRSRLQGFVLHWGGIIATVLLATLPPLRWLARRYVYQPGEGATEAERKRDWIEFRSIADPDYGSAAAVDQPAKQAFCRATYQGNMYTLTGILVAEGARSVLEDDTQLSGGIYTAALLGQGMIDRLEKAGFHFETKVIDA